MRTEAGSISSDSSLGTNSGGETNYWRGLGGLGGCWGLVTVICAYLVFPTSGEGVGLEGVRDLRESTASLLRRGRRRWGRACQGGGVKVGDGGGASAGRRRNMGVVVVGGGGGVLVVDRNGNHVGRVVLYSVAAWGGRDETAKGRAWVRVRRVSEVPVRWYWQGGKGEREVPDWNVLQLLDTMLVQVRHLGQDHILLLAVRQFSF